MPESIAKKVRSWDREYIVPPEENLDLDFADENQIEKALESANANYQAKYSRIFSQIEFLSDKLYNGYEVAKNPPYLEFPNRLRNWINSAETEIQEKILFELVPRLFYIGKDEYHSLYRAAFNGPIIRWIIEEINLNFESDEIEKKISDAIKSTWFCQITDSMNIASFYHINGINGSDLRPDIRSLSKLGDKQKLLQFMKDQAPPLERIVLLEDFIATGSQMCKSVEFIVNLDSNIKTLLCPLVICPSGNELAKKMTLKFSDNLKYDPALLLDDSIVLKRDPQEGEENFISLLRKTVIDLEFKVRGTSPHQWYSSFGFGEKSEKGGLLVVMYSNCPDNTIPLVHFESDGPWHPLFPRSSRL